MLPGVSKETSRLVRENLNDLKSRFQALDRKRTGVIAEQEMRYVLQGLGIQVQSLDSFQP